MKRCTTNEQETCQVEKMGCEGCYYNMKRRKEKMYKVNLNLSNELKEGLKIKYIAECLGLSHGFVSQVLNGKKNCSKIIAKGIISIKYNVSINSNEANQNLIKFFKKI